MLGGTNCSICFHIQKMLQFVLAFEYNLLIGNRIFENANQYVFFQCLSTQANWWRSKNSATESYKDMKNIFWE